MTHDQWLEQPYVSSADRQSSMELMMEEIFYGYDKLAMFKEFMEDATYDDILAQYIVEKKFAEAGRCLWSDYIDWLWDCAQTEAEHRIRFQ
jgi:hypothetical protein